MKSESNPRGIEIKHFDYTLPPKHIALFPTDQREQSKLLRFLQGRIEDFVFYQLATMLTPGDCLIFNNSRVIEARLLFTKPTGGVIEVFCLEPDDRYGGITEALNQTMEVYWKCLVGGASKWKPGTLLSLSGQYHDQPFQVSVRFVERLTDSFLLHFTWNNDELNFQQVLQAIGNIPIPPYLNRKAVLGDQLRYQTVLANRSGSVAAPTAALHFTPSLLQELTNNGIRHHEITLHVGAGTFMPVKSEKLEGHAMHYEFIEITLNDIQWALDAYPNLIAVGTTSLRTMESMYWMGQKTYTNPSISLKDLEIKQWEPYDWNQPLCSVQEALQALMDWLLQRNLQQLVVRTGILIAPPYSIKTVKALITNFHQPQSTLLLLVAALVGDENWKAIYQHALNHDYRFLSYGDGSILYNANMQ